MTFASFKVDSRCFLLDLPTSFIWVLHGDIFDLKTIIDHNRPCQVIENHVVRLDRSRENTVDFFDEFGVLSDRNLDHSSIELVVKVP